jgi:hypothetical protein
MREGPRFTTWRGDQYRFERLQDQGDRVHRNPVWAVSRHREFVGKMSCADEETNKEFDARCLLWLTALLG